MTIDAAVKILNEYRHRAMTDWHYLPQDGIAAAGEYYSITLTEFESVAVAEKYLKDATLTTKRTRTVAVGE